MSEECFIRRSIISQQALTHPYAVYHTLDVVIIPDPQAWQNRDWKFRHVANVYAPRDHIFFLTNHSEEENWTNRSEIFWIAPDLHPRSTSVGDVICSLSTGRAWIVMSNGLQEIPSPFLKDSDL